MGNFITIVVWKFYEGNDDCFFHSFLIALTTPQSTLTTTAWNVEIRPKTIISILQDKLDIVEDKLDIVEVKLDIVEDKLDIVEDKLDKVED